ncbi:MAG: site-2 protease family protein [Coriobacteriia bacterium]|nr:site-2 protease family protein [Coriobacteriia bacterium]
MFNLPSIRIGSFFGIPVEVNATWFAIFFLFAFLLGFTYFPEQFPGQPLWVDIARGVLTAVLFFASVVVHELSHSLVARAGGVRISRITLFIFGGVAQMEEEPKTPGREALMAFAGPGMSLLLSAVFFLAYVLSANAGAPDLVWAPLQYLAIINLAVAVFNLMPGFPLDGGRVLRAAVWGVTGDLLKSTRWASRAGQFIGYSLVTLAVVAYVFFQSLDFLWIGLVGWFIASIAGNAYRQQLIRSRLADVTVGGVMSPEPVVVPAGITLERLAHDYFLGQRHSRYPVRDDGQVVGLITLAEAKTVPREQWGDVLVKDVADLDLGRLTVRRNQPLDEVLERLGPEEPGALLVVEDGALTGIVTRSDVIRQLRVQDALAR